MGLNFNFVNDLFFQQDLPNHLVCVFDRGNQLLYHNRALGNYFRYKAISFDGLLNQLRSLLPSYFAPSYFSNPEYCAETIQWERSQTRLIMFPLSRDTFALRLVPDNGFPDYSQLMRFFLHNMRTPLSTAVMALNNMKFFLQNHSSSSETDFSEFIDTADEALKEALFPLDTVHTLIRNRGAQMQNANLPLLIEDLFSTLWMRCQVSINSSPEIRTISMDEQVLSLALRLLFYFLEKICQPDDHLRINLNESNSGLRLEFLLQNEMESAPFFFIDYYSLPDHQKYLLAGCELLLYQYDAHMRGFINVQDRKLHLIIHYSSEVQKKNE